MKGKRFFNRIRTCIMRAFFNLLYHQFAWSYDFIASLVSLGNWKRWILTVMPHLEGPRVLELGHGPGHLQCALRKYGVNTFGIDESRSMGKLAADHIKKHDGHTNLMRGYAQLLPVQNHSIHQVVATFPSEYIFDPMTFSEVHRVLVTGGKLVVLPFVEITGNKLLDRLANCLFNITGQTTHWDDQMLTPFRKAGFSTVPEHVSEESWSLTTIIGIKN
jgi:ubiquinone/menaquinone biosynthesis C-methylase UbiE